LRPPGGAWTVRQEYSTSNTFSWPITGLALGTYGIEVDERSQGSSEPYQKVSNVTYVLAISPCASASLAPSPASPSATGSAVTFTAASTGCVSPRYRFWVRTPDGAWTIRQDYGASNVFVWSATGRAGTYGIEVDVRDALASVSYDTVRNTTHVLAGCTAAGLTAAPANSAPHGTAITLTATATCPGGSPTYKFWIKGPGGSWTVVQQYSPSGTYPWTPISPGTYYLEVDVRNQGGTDSYEKVAGLVYIVT